jgi:UvrD/REP helicase N-terminal domain
MPIRYLINPDGAPFNADELDALTGQLNALNDDERKKLRNENATAIALHDAAAILIVAGPGTGKSTLFKQRIVHWLNQSPAARILALSFVRKLVADLNADIQTDSSLTDKQRKQVDVYTLHKYARSVVEKNGGTREWKFAAHLRIIVDCRNLFADRRGIRARCGQTDRSADRPHRLYGGATRHRSRQTGVE